MGGASCNMVQLVAMFVNMFIHFVVLVAIDDRCHVPYMSGTRHCALDVSAAITHAQTLEH